MAQNVFCSWSMARLSLRLRRVSKTKQWETFRRVMLVVFLISWFSMVMTSVYARLASGMLPLNCSLLMPVRDGVRRGGRQVMPVGKATAFRLVHSKQETAAAVIKSADSNNCVQKIFHLKRSKRGELSRRGRFRCERFLERFGSLRLFLENVQL